jgi:hypothetical protein
MRPHIEAEKYLAQLELRKMIARSYALEATSHIFGQTCPLECIYTPGKMQRNIAVMQILDKVYGCIYRRISFRICLAFQSEIVGLICIAGIITLDSYTGGEQPMIPPLCFYSNQRS